MFKKNKPNDGIESSVAIKPEPQPRKMTFICECWIEPYPEDALARMYHKPTRVKLSCGNLAAEGNAHSWGLAFEQAYEQLRDAAALERLSAPQ